MKVAVCCALLLAAVALASAASYAGNDHKVAIDAPPSRERPRPQKNKNVKTEDRKKRSTTWDCGKQPLFTASQATESVDQHNKWRGQEGASNMLKQVWSDEMAAISQAWADECIWEHGMLYDCDGNRLGQNLFVESSSAGYPALNMTYVIKAWNDERYDWDWNLGECKPGKLCGHWTQLVWARSGYVGCASKNCPTINVAGSVWHNALLVVCDYTKPGNIYGEFSFEKGAGICTNCDSDHDGGGFKCSSNLCEHCTPGTAGCSCGTPLACMNGGYFDQTSCGCKCPSNYYGTHCEFLCSCEDLDPESCPHWIDFCPDPDYSDFMYEQCRKTCHFPCHLPPSCGAGK